MADEIEAQEQERKTAEPAHVRIVTTGATSKDAVVEIVEDGEVVAVPNVRKATVTLEAGKLTTADLEVLIVDGDVTAQLVRLREIAVPPERKPLLMVTVCAPYRRWYGLRRSTVLVQRWTPAGNVGYLIEALQTATAPASAYAMHRGVEE